MATPEPINNPMMGMFGNQPTMYPAMMGNIGQQRPMGGMEGQQRSGLQSLPMPM